MAKAAGSFIWYELMTTDPEGARAFYNSVLGWNITLGSEPPIYYGHISNPDGGNSGGLLPLTADMQAGGARPAWVGYIGVDDIDAATDALLAAGGKVLMPKMTIEVGSFTMVADCCGAPFYLMQPVMPEGGADATPVFSPDLIGRCCWNELSAGDPAAAIAFYTGLFGWTLPEPMDMGPLGKYQFIEHDGVGIGAIMPKMAETPMPVWAYYFRVADLDKAKAAVTAGGGQVVHGPMQVPGDDWVLSAIDPQGAFVGLVSKVCESGAAEQ